MPVSVSSASFWIRVGLAAAYLVLAVLLSPLLLQHELALPSDAHHSEADFCAWLDHVAGTSLLSAHADVTVTLGVATAEATYQPPLRSAPLFIELSRGPPALI